MYFALICRDKPDALQIRLDTRPDHVAYLKDLDKKGMIKAAGPLLDDEGNPSGSLIIVESENKAMAEDIAAQDPYGKRGLFAEVEIKPYTWIFHAPEA